MKTRYDFVMICSNLIKIKYLEATWNPTIYLKIHALRFFHFQQTFFETGNLKINIPHISNIYPMSSKRNTIHSVTFSSKFECLMNTNLVMARVLLSSVVSILVALFKFVSNIINIDSNIKKAKDLDSNFNRSKFHILKLLIIINLFLVVSKM